MEQQIVAQDKWSNVIFWPEWNSLELKWLPTTKDATEDDVKSSMVKFAAEGEARRPLTMIVDALDFRHQWGDGMMDWRNREIIPRYNSAGVRRFAFIASPDYPGETAESGLEPAPEGPAKFPTGWFKSRESAYEWLGGA
jgi:hypothetical protein